jgi:FixJ family two-component response regulator
MADDGKNARVAVIEDDDVGRSALGRLLKVSGFEPALFESAEAFMAQPSERDWLCLIVDVQLTGMSGIDLQRRVRAEGSAVPIIIVTANKADVVRERAQQIGCAAFLSKPFNGNIILSILDSIARQSHP